MSSPSKSAPSHIDTARAGGLYRVAIVGASSLKGKEVAEVLDDRNFPSVDIKLLDDDETIGQLESVRDEINFIQRLRAEQFGVRDVHVRHGAGGARKCNVGADLVPFDLRMRPGRAGRGSFPALGDSALEPCSFKN